jgi:hypothetical protein
MERIIADRALKDHLLRFSRATYDAFTIEAEAHDEGWVFYVSPANLSFDREMPFTIMPFFRSCVGWPCTWNSNVWVEDSSREVARAPVVTEADKVVTPD